MFLLLIPGYVCYLSQNVADSITLRVLVWVEFFFMLTKIRVKLLFFILTVKTALKEILMLSFRYSMQRFYCLFIIGVGFQFNLYCSNVSLIVCNCYSNICEINKKTPNFSSRNWRWSGFDKTLINYFIFMLVIRFTLS